MNVNEMTREQMNEWYLENIGYAPDSEEGELMTDDEFRSLITEYQVAVEAEDANA